MSCRFAWGNDEQSHVCHGGCAVTVRCFCAEHRCPCGKTLIYTCSFHSVPDED